jgi:hypothetical protein
MGLIIVKNFPNRLYAEQAEQLLKEEDIPSVRKAPDYGVSGSGSGIFVGASQGVDLYVPEEFFEKASGLIASFFGGI